MGSYQANLEMIAQKLTQARFQSGKSMKDCAHAIGSTSAHYKKIECGEIYPTLPEMETLSYFLNVPLFELLSDHKSTDLLVKTGNTAHLIEIRNNVIGTLLQIERERKNIALVDLAKRCGIQRSRLKRYESGTTRIPVDDLLSLADALSIDLETFLDQNSAMGIWQKSQQNLRAFSSLPAHIQEFVTDPANPPYLELAQKLKGMQPKDLAAIAEAIQLMVQLLPKDPAQEPDQTQQ